MNRLFRANFTRLLKDYVFWLISVVLFGYAVIYMLNGCRQEKSGLAGGRHFLEDYYFQFAIVIGLFAAVFITLYLSVEYSDGVVRNKIIAGYTRRSIYLSNLLLTFCASFFMMCMGLLGGLVGIPTFGVWNMGAFPVFVCVLVLMMFLFAFCAIFTFINMLLQNKSVGAVVTILVFFALLFVASTMMNRLAQPETVSDVMFTAEGVVFDDPKPNPLYVDGAARGVLDFVIDVIPAGQGLRLASNEVAHPVRMLLSSMVLAVLVTIMGIFAFERKDLK